MHPQSTPTRQQFVAVCGCGCGEPTLLAGKTNPSLGHRAGQPLLFLWGHNPRGVKRPQRAPRPVASLLQFVAVCACGCGQPTVLARRTNAACGDVRGVPRRFVHHHHMRGSNSFRWNGGRYQNAAGYVWVKRLDHPHADSRGYMQEHRLVVEARLGRYLTPEEIVHHRDGNPANNADGNLELTNRADHARMHDPVQFRPSR